MRARILLMAATTAALGALALPGAAAASPCEVTHTDGAGFTWSLDEFGEAIDGGKSGEAGDPYGSITDGFPLVTLAHAGDDPFQGGSSYVTGSTSCVPAQGAQETVYPPQALVPNVPEVTLTRRVYVPATGRPFARWVDTMKNTSSTTRAYDMLLFGSLGSDCGTSVASTSSGDGLLTRVDRWVTSFDSQAGDDTCTQALFSANPDDSTGLPLAHNWDGPSTPPDRLDAFPTPFNLTFDPGGTPMVEYRDIVLAPGQAVSYVHFEAQSTTVANNVFNANNAAKGIDGEPAELWAGMSAVDRALVRNWCIGDCDKDSAADASDNCKGVANPGQLNSDNDPNGDACDGDDDNDGRSDALETELGTNPRSPKDAAPRVSKFTAPKTAKLGRKVTMSAVANDDYGVRRVAFFAGDRRLCVDATAPYRCKWRFGGKGTRILEAIATDAIGQVGARARKIKVTP
ncbi:MAG TPA: Ig-like domain-containing protein [Thermoleophilaceae bacterium]|nr:Ig-like domain-containing protein [Thermoleophilaceae bacterium]